MVGQGPPYIVALGVFEDSGAALGASTRRNCNIEMDNRNDSVATGANKPELPEPLSDKPFGLSGSIFLADLSPIDRQSRS